jgi:hypothetical protein
LKLADHTLVSKTRQPPPADGSTLPVDVLDVVILRYRKAVAAFETPPFQYFAAFRRGHTFSETVHPHSPAYFWLISSFRHILSLL